MSDSQFITQNQKDSSNSWLQDLIHLPTDWALLPLDANKVSWNPKTGRKISNWNSLSGYDSEDIISMSPPACGVLLGPNSGALLAVDFDGPGSEKKFEQIFDRTSSDLPQSIACTSGRVERRQVFFVVDQEWWSYLPGGKAFKDSSGSTILELRWTGQQSAIAGAHPLTNGYSWIHHCSPQLIPKPALAPEWLLAPLLKDEFSEMPFTPTPNDYQRAIEMLRCLPQDHFDTYIPWLQVGMSLHSVSRDLLGAWVEWSWLMPTFDEQECLDKWKSFSPRTSMLTIRSLHQWAKKHGYKDSSMQSPGIHIVPRGSRGGNVGKVSWIIEGFLAKGATTLLASEAGAGKTSLIMRAAASIELGQPFLDHIETTKGRALIIQGDEPEVDSLYKQRLMDLQGICDFAYLTGTLDLDWYERVSKSYSATFIDSSTSLLAHEGSYHEDPAFTTKLYGIGAINSANGIGCIITSHLRKSADGVPRKDLSVEDIAGRATIRNALQDYWGLMRNPSPRWDEHYTLKCFGKRYCRLGEQWELQGDPESFWWGIQDVHNGLPPKQRRILEDSLVQRFKINPEPLSASCLATELGMNYEHVRRCCLALFTQDRLKRIPERQGQMGRPTYKYYLK